MLSIVTPWPPVGRRNPRSAGTRETAQGYCEDLRGDNIVRAPRNIMDVQMPDWFRV